MSKKWLLPMLTLLLASFVVACDGGGDDNPADDGGTDADVTDDGSGDDGAEARTEPNPEDGVLSDWVLDTVRIGNQDEGEGFNLDDLVTRPGHPYLPEDGPGGVDNQLGGLIAALEDAGLDVNADASIADGIADGSLLILLRMKDVDDWTADPGLVYLYGYAGKDADEPEDTTNNLSGHGQLLVDERSLNAPYTDLEDSLISFTEGGILNDTTAADTNLQVGDVTFGPSLFRVSLPVSGSNLELAVNGTRIVADIETAPTGTPAVDGALINGLLGGYIYLGDAARALSEIDLSGTSIDADTLRSILAGQADMDVIPAGFEDTTCTLATAVSDCAPGQTCEEDPGRGNAFYCYEQDENLDAISLGLVFTAIGCEITGIADDPEFP